MADEITLKVAEAISQKDVGQGVARLDPNIMDDLDIKERDLIEIVGERRLARLVAKCPFEGCLFKGEEH